jgi:hypothetical protein
LCSRHAGRRPTCDDNDDDGTANDHDNACADHDDGTANDHDNASADDDDSSSDHHDVLFDDDDHGGEHLLLVDPVGVDRPRHRPRVGRARPRPVVDRT